jgi:peptide-methionine (S)-S-oxide reductase
MILSVVPRTRPLEVAIFGAGCFWAAEEAFAQIDGVVETTVGYQGGTTPSPTFRDVCSGDTGHVEVVRVVFDPAAVAYEQLLECFWRIHDPTSIDRQGHDVGPQYRSTIFAQGGRQRALAEASKLELELSGAYRAPVVTAIVSRETPFFRAEDYHQHYLARTRLRDEA